MNLSQTILNMTLGVVPLVPIVIALVQWVKVTFKTSDATVLNLCSMWFGLVFGGGFMLAQSVPTDFNGWFLDVVYGIILGLTASGLFKTGIEFTERANPKITPAKESQV